MKDAEIVEIALRKVAASTKMPDVKDALNKVGDEIYVMMRHRDEAEEAEKKNGSAEEDKVA